MLALPAPAGRAPTRAGRGREPRKPRRDARQPEGCFLIGGPIALLLTSFGATCSLARRCGRSRPCAVGPLRSRPRRSTSAYRFHLRTTRSRGSADTLNEMLARLEDGLERERRFVADASHELRTPLALLRTELELALRRSRTTQEFENSIRSAAEETDRLSRIADDLLVRRARRAGDAGAAPGADRPRGRRREGSRPLRCAGRARRALAGGRRGRGARARVDRPRVEQALGNLVDNAFEHGRGTITITRGPAQLERRAACARRGPRSPAGLPRPRLQAVQPGDDPSGSGSGLGLAIVETIARAHDGRPARGSARTGARTSGSDCPCRVGAVEEALLAWFDEHGRDLPWRKTRDPYAILVSEVMLQQTQVARVVPRYLALARALADGRGARRRDAGDVIREWQGLGYNRRAVNLHRAAQQDRREGWPRRPDRASRSRSVHRRRRRPVRLRPPGASRRRELRRVLDRTEGSFGPASAHALMDLGATVCLARIPRCGECPLADDCPSRGSRYEPLRKQEPVRRLVPATARPDADSSSPSEPRRRNSLDDDAVAALAADGLVEVRRGLVSLPR